jgi:hypothetical protein
MAICRMSRQSSQRCGCYWGGLTSAYLTTQVSGLGVFTQSLQSGQAEGIDTSRSTGHLGVWCAVGVV